MSGAAGPAVLLVAHGSRDARAAVTVRRVVDRLRRRTGWRVEVAYLDFTDPSVGAALTELAADGVRDVVAVPLLFAPGYHVRVDLPAAIAEVRVALPWLSVTVAEPLGASPEAGEPDRLLDALTGRLGAVSGGAGIVLASAGSSDPLSRKAIEDLAARWAVRVGRPVLPAYATGVGRSVGEAVAELRGAGCATVVVSGLFLAPGRLPEAVRRAAREAGADAVADPLGDDPHLVDLLAARAIAAVGQPAPAR